VIQTQPQVLDGVKQMTFKFKTTYSADEVRYLRVASVRDVFELKDPVSEAIVNLLEAHLELGNRISEAIATPRKHRLACEPSHEAAIKEALMKRHAAGKKLMSELDDDK
jgi:hypothetical protein